MDYRSFSADTTRTSSISLLKSVYLWMALALSVTGVTAWMVATSSSLQALLFSSSSTWLILLIAELGLVWYLSARILSLSFSTASLLYLLYSILNGLTLSVILLAYTKTSIASTFFITAGTFAAVSIYGYFTRKDLSSWGNILLMGVIGIIIASIVNFFLKSSALSWAISYIGVILFVGLTAYDTQKIKKLLGGSQLDEQGQKLALLGSLTLYLDFINLFLFLLRIFGRRQ